MAFDATSIIDKFATVWATVFTTLGLNTDYIYKYYEYREKSLQNIPSVVIKKVGGNVGSASGRPGRQTQRNLERIFTRISNIEIVITCHLKENNLLYCERLWSLFLRELTNGDTTEAGDSIGISIDRTRLITLNTMTELFGSIELTNQSVERLVITVPCEFDEYFEKFTI